VRGFGDVDGHYVLRRARAGVAIWAGGGIRIGVIAGHGPAAACGGGALLHRRRPRPRSTRPQRRPERPLVAEADPASAPLASRQQAHLPPRWRAGGGHAILVPHRHDPAVALARHERLASVLDVSRCGALDPAAIPHDAVRRPDAGDFDAVLGLPRSTAGAVEDPAQARSRYVDAQRLAQILAAQVDRAYRRATRSGGRRRAHPFKPLAKP